MGMVANVSAGARARHLGLATPLAQSEIRSFAFAMTGQTRCVLAAVELVGIQAVQFLHDCGLDFALSNGITRFSIHWDFVISRASGCEWKQHGDAKPRRIVSKA